MSDLLGTTVEDLVAALKRRRAPLPFEIGTFVALSVAESLLGRPALVKLADVRIAEDGSVSVFAPPNSTTDEASARSVVALLAHLLVAAGPGVPAQLLQLVERGPGDPSLRLERVRDELEAALVPLNRGASRRVLARLLRESTREPLRRPGSMPPPAPAPASVDDALDALLGGPSPAPAAAPPAPAGGPATNAAARPATPLAFDEDLHPDRFARPTPPSGMSRLDALAELENKVAAAFDSPTAPRHAPVPAVGADDIDQLLADTAVGLDAPMRTEAGYVPEYAAGEGDDFDSDAHTAEYRAASGAALDAPAPEAPYDPRRDHDGEEPTRRRATDRPPPYGGEAPPPSPGAALPPPARVPAEAARLSARAADTPVPSRPAPTPPPAADVPGALGGRVSLDGFDDAPPKGKGGALAVVGALALLGVLVGGAFVLRPDLLDRLRGAPDPAEAAAAEAAAARAREQAELNRRHAERYGELRVSSTPDRAQVLLFIGRAPVVVEGLPLGVAHEFVVLADGKSASRAVVPPNAEWDREEGQARPRFELAVQAGETDVAFDALELGPTRLPRDVGTPSQELGDVRVVTTPRGARVFQVVGFTPDVRVTDLDTTSAVELLVWAEGHVAQRVVVGPSDWRTEGGHKVADVTVTLVPRPAAGVRRGR